jgi:phospholipase/carboxylesterase
MLALPHGVDIVRQTRLESTVALLAFGSQTVQVPMNRIRPESSLIDPQLSIAAVGAAESVQSPRISGRGSYSLFAPQHYEPNYAYPLIVWLHGPGEDEHQLRRIMPSISLRNYVAVAPRGTVAATAATVPKDATASAAAAVPTGFGWRQSDGHIQAAELRVMECLDAAAEKLHIAPNRRFLAGYGCGGTMAFRIALRNPQCFAGVLSLSGPFPSGRTPLAQLHDVRRLEVFIACCRAGGLYPTDTVCHDLRLLHTAGMSVVLREYPGDDALAAQMLADMDRWLMEQVTGTGSKCQEAGRVRGQGSGASDEDPAI